ncbi:DUF6252 family protein [Hymenobacter elongatus]|uniref:Uncharacterized protein n=1 Tax=Hymenobacter elongatus TaxID=877208 RepID=A0A4Z0PQZ9_9BACT|nr:DUF6252 family protein [Hymenobacter elongatus]TGE17605.1 hypothetical protein E5J99_07065 [Hymenobacter elongatus]
MTAFLCFALFRNKSIVLRNAFTPGNYLLKAVQSGSNGYYKDASGQYFTDDLQTGEVVITRIDTIQKIAAGTFRFSAAGISTASGQTVTITQGRFDVRLK